MRAERMSPQARSAALALAALPARAGPAVLTGLTIWLRERDPKYDSARPLTSLVTSLVTNLATNLMPTPTSARAMAPLDVCVDSNCDIQIATFKFRLDLQDPGRGTLLLAPDLRAPDLRLARWGLSLEACAHSLRMVYAPFAVGISRGHLFIVFCTFNEKSLSF